MACTKRPIPARTLAIIARIDELYIERVVKGEVTYEKAVQRRPNL